MANFATVCSQGLEVHNTKLTSYPFLPLNGAFKVSALENEAHLACEYIDCKTASPLFPLFVPPRDKHCLLASMIRI